MAKATDYTRQEQAKLQAIMTYETYVEQLQLRSDIAKRKSQLAKRQLENALAELRELIKSDPAQQRLPGMEEQYDAPKLPTWHETPISVVIADKSICEKLAEHNITNMGQLATYTNADQPLTKVGLSEQQEAKVIESLRIYWETEPGTN